MAWTERYVRTDAAGGGDGTTNTNSGANGAWTLAEAIANVAAGQRVNVKSGTYALSSAITFAVAGTSTTPIWWRGFSSTIGDLDTETDHTLFPWFDMTGASVFLTVSGAFNWISNIRLTADNTASLSAAINWTGADGRCFHNHVTGEAADIDGHAISLANTSDRTMVFCNSFFATTTATACFELVSSAALPLVFSNYISGGNIGASIASTCTFRGNIITGCSAQGINLTVGAVAIEGNTFHSTGGPGIRITTGVRGVAVANNIFSDVATYAVSHADTDSSTLVTNNAYWDITTAQLENIDEQFNAITCSASPFVNAGSGDFTPTSEVKSLGIPPRIGIAGPLNFTDIGAIQAQSASSGGKRITSFIG